MSINNRHTDTSRRTSTPTVSMFLLFSEFDTIMTLYFIFTNKVPVIFYIMIAIGYVLSISYQVTIFGYKGLPFLRLYYKIQPDKLTQIVIVSLEDYVIMWTYINKFDEFDNVSKLIFFFEVYWFSIHMNSLSRKYFPITVVFYTVATVFTSCSFSASIFVIENVAVKIIYAITVCVNITLFVFVMRRKRAHIYRYCVLFIVVCGMAMLLRLTLEFDFRTLVTMWMALLFLNLLYKNSDLKHNYYLNGTNMLHNERTIVVHSQSLEERNELRVVTRINMLHNDRTTGVHCRSIEERKELRIVT